VESLPFLFPPARLIVIRPEEAMSRVSLLLVLALMLSTASWAQTAPEAAIHHLMDQQAADWNRGDVDAFMKAYEDAPTTTFVGKTVEYGYSTIRERYKRIYPTPAGMGKLTFTHLAIRVLDSNYAVATGNFHLERTAAGGGNADGIFSLLLKKDPQGWKIILDHSNRTG
jgi:uncharacterized protein (TIGR02246 family)